MNHIPNPAFLLNYNDNYLISKNLELVNKNDVINSSFLQKFIYWVNGTFDAKKTAMTIDKYMQGFLDQCAQNPTHPDVQQLPLALEKLTLLHNKFSQKKGISHLKEVIQTIQNCLERLPILKPTTEIKTKPVVKELVHPQQTSKRIPSSQQPSTHVQKVKSKNKPNLSPKVPRELTHQLKTIQDDMNRLDSRSSDFCKQAQQIQTSLKKTITAYPNFKDQLSPLADVMQNLAQKGNRAFKLDFFQENLLQKINGTYSPPPLDAHAPLVKLLQFLKISDQTHTSEQIAEQLLNKSSQIQEKWKQLENDVFESQLHVKSPHMKEKAKAIKQTLMAVNKELTSFYQEFCNLMTPHYASEGFQSLLSHYPHDDIVKNQSLILEQTLDYLTDQLLKKDNLSSQTNPNNLKAIQQELYQAGRQEIESYLKASLEKYTWWQNNLSCIKVPYDQGADHDRNQGEGTCMQNSISRYQLLSNQPDKPTHQIKMGSDLQERVRQAKLNVGLQFGVDVLADFSKVLATQGIDANKCTSKTYTLANNHPDYDQLVDTLIKPPQKGKPLTGLFVMSSEKSKEIRQIHTFNIQVDPKLKKFRILDDNIGAIEFSSLKEFKKQFAAYLKAFYPEYTKFSTVIP